jgi:RNA polymerase sigma-70 factor (ECF subfamily)
MDPKRLDELFRAYKGTVYRRACAILADKESAWDVTQEVFMKAMNMGDEFLKVASPMAWLYRVTTNLCLKIVRDSGRRRKILGEQRPIAAPATDLPVDVALTLHKMLSRVPEDLQEVAVYYYVDRMTQEEISDLLDMPRRTVSYRLEQFRAAALSHDLLTQRASSR